LVVLYHKARRDVDAYLSGSPVSEDDEEELAGSLEETPYLP